MTTYLILDHLHVLSSLTPDIAKLLFPAIISIEYPKTVDSLIGEVAKELGHLKHLSSAKQHAYRISQLNYEAYTDEELEHIVNEFKGKRST